MTFSWQNISNKKRQNKKKVIPATCRLQQVYVDEEHIMLCSNTDKDVFGNLLDTNVKKLTDDGYFVCIVYK